MRLARSRPSASTNSLRNNPIASASKINIRRCLKRMTPDPSSALSSSSKLSSPGFIDVILLILPILTRPKQEGTYQIELPVNRAVLHRLGSSRAHVTHRSLAEPMPRHYSWSFGWEEMVQEVAKAYQSVPAADRAD